MHLPFELKKEPFRIRTTSTVTDLMDKAEDAFAIASAQAGIPKELHITVLWNIKDHKKALNPSEQIEDHFVDGATFGVYGDITDVTPPEPMKKENEKIPVTILTGFLGSGKTTLLNYILREQKDMKIAVIENEFGEISIDDALLKKDKMATAEKILVMDNGCMCCTIRGDLIAGLQEMIDAIRKGDGINCIMIETTGMADPVPIIRTFMSSPDITDELRLDAVIALASAKHLPDRLNDEVEDGKVNEAYQQVAFADKIILNKQDLVSTEEAIACKDMIRKINSFAKVLPAVKGRVKLSELFNIHAHDMVGFTDQDIAAQAPEPEFEQGHGGHGEDGAHGGHDGNWDEAGHEGHGDHSGHGGHGEQDGHGGHDGHGDGDAEGRRVRPRVDGGDHSVGHGGAHSAGHGAGHGGSQASRHDARVGSFSVVKEGEIIPERLTAWMQLLKLMSKERGTVFRIKAILAVKGHPFKLVYHAVMDADDEDDAGPWLEGEKKISKIVFIGKSLDQVFLRQAFLNMFEKK